MTQPPLVLIVDDDSRSRELVTHILRHAGYAVTAAAHPPQAMALLAEVRPVLALVDYLMPGMNGLEFCRWLRQQPSLATMRCVLLTGMDSGDFSAAAWAAGADDIVIKPFDRIELLARLSALLQPPAAG
jgi:DNA-binding response OmpR family regulator